MALIYLNDEAKTKSKVYVQKATVRRALEIKEKQMNNLRADLAYAEQDAHFYKMDNELLEECLKESDRENEKLWTCIWILIGFCVILGIL